MIVIVKIVGIRIEETNLLESLIFLSHSAVFPIAVDIPHIFNISHPL